MKVKILVCRNGLYKVYDDKEMLFILDSWTETKELLSDFKVTKYQLIYE